MHPLGRAAAPMRTAVRHNGNCSSVVADGHFATRRRYPRPLFSRSNNSVTCVPCPSLSADTQSHDAKFGQSGIVVRLDG